MKSFTIVALAFCLSVASADIWAVLIAGSNEFYNYRHQADICHAYQVLRKHGVPETNIITLAYDDIANNEQNPFPGKIFNKPAADKGQDVYAGCQIDYKGKDVNIKNFLGVLTGDKKATGGKKVLNSTANDHVFINFADHGGVGLIGVIDEYLYADKLLTALQTMHTKKMYNRLVFYMEACESGSMFTHLPNNLNIYVATASNPSESSWGCYCPPDDSVGGTELNTCLGDTFSVVWMENSDASNLHTETLEQQFKALLPLVNQSHPQQYGTKAWLNETVSDYLGAQQTTNLLRGYKFKAAPITGQQNSRDGKLISVKAAYDRNPTRENFEAYMNEVKSIQFFDGAFEKIDYALGHDAGKLLNTDVDLPADLSCLRTAVDTFETVCTKFTDYGLKYVKTLAHLCYSHKIDQFTELFKTACSQELLELLA